jgi:hypothetical protein
VSANGVTRFSLSAMSSPQGSFRRHSSQNSDR